MKKKIITVCKAVILLCILAFSGVYISLPEKEKPILIYNLMTKLLRLDYILFEACDESRIIYTRNYEESLSEALKKAREKDCEVKIRGSFDRLVVSNRIL